MKAYQYHNKYPHIFLTEVQCMLSPKDLENGDEVYLIPGNCSIEEPPEPLENHVVCMDIESGNWVQIPNYIGKQYWTRDGDRVTIETFGVVPSEDWTTEKPATYSYDPVTGELSENKTGHWTTKTPPTKQDKKAIVFDGTDWVLVDDFRGQEYYLPDNAVAIISAIGEKVPTYGSLVKNQQVVPGSIVNGEWAVTQEWRDGLEVERYKVKLALIEMGLKQQVDALVEASNDPVLKLIYHEKPVFRRTSEFVESLMASLGKTEHDADLLFTIAKSK